MKREEVVQSGLMQTGPVYRKGSRGVESSSAFGGQICEQAGEGFGETLPPSGRSALRASSFFFFFLLSSFFLLLSFSCSFLFSQVSLCMEHYTWRQPILSYHLLAS
jgi:hypothetical protein